jgi:hypothetical protein
MDFDMAGVNHEPLKVRIVNQLFEEFLPSPLVTPAAETAMRIFPVAIVRRQVAPRRSGAQYPEDAIKKSAIILRKTAPLTGLAWKMDRKQFPRVIAQIVTVIGWQLIAHISSVAHHLFS